MEYPFGTIPDEDTTGIKRWNLIHDEMIPIIKLYNLPDITDIFIDRYDRISVMRKGMIEKTNCAFESEEALVSLIEQIATTLNQEFTLASPLFDARLPDGSRINATHVSTTPSGATMSLRKVPKQTLVKNDFTESGMLTEEMLDYLCDMIMRKDIFLISGNMGSGKTSLLRLLAEFIDKRERLITAEDTQELHLHDMFPFGIAMEAPNRKDCAVDLPALIHSTLRQQPDRVWVGELRKAAAVDALMQIIYTGVRGCAATIHGSSSLNAIIRMQYLLASSGKVDYHLTGELIRGAIDVIVQTHRDPKWGRRVTEISRIIDGQVTMIFKFNTKTGVHERVDGE